MPVDDGRRPVMREVRDGLQRGGLAVGVGEGGAAFGEAVEVGGFHLRVAAEGGDPVVEVVDGDEEDVGTIFSRK